jgi:hypothetical protein
MPGWEYGKQIVKIKICICFKARALGHFDTKIKEREEYEEN